MGNLTQRRRVLKRNPERRPKSHALMILTLNLRRKTEKRRKRRRGRNLQVKSRKVRRRDPERNTRKIKSIRNTRRVRSIRRTRRGKMTVMTATVARRRRLRGNSERRH